MDKRNRKKKTVDDTVCEIHKFSGYAVLSNCFVRSTNLGCPAIGLLGRVMDLPPEWNFSKAGLIAICPDGEMILSIKLDTLTARILKLSSDGHIRIVPAPLYSGRKPADR